MAQIDWLLAAVLERKKALRLDYSDIAEMVGGISGDALRQLVARKAPEEWPKRIRDGVCKALGIEVKTIVVGSPEDRCGLR